MTKRQPEPQAGTWGLQAPTSSPTGDICGEGAGPSGACLGHPGLCSVSRSPLQSPGAVDPRHRLPHSRLWTGARPAARACAGPCADLPSTAPPGPPPRRSSASVHWPDCTFSRTSGGSPVISFQETMLQPHPGHLPSGLRPGLLDPRLSPLLRPGLPIPRPFDSASGEVREEVKSRAPAERSQTSSAKPVGILHAFVKKRALMRHNSHAMCPGLNPISLQSCH